MKEERVDVKIYLISNTFQTILQQYIKNGKHSCV